MITVDVSEEYSLPAIENPSDVNWQIKKMTNTTTGRDIINSFKDEYREYKINSNGNILEKKRVYDSMDDASKGHSSGKSWVETSLSMDGRMIGVTDGSLFVYEIVSEDGIVVSVELIEKDPNY